MALYMIQYSNMTVDAATGHVRINCGVERRQGGVDPATGVAWDAQTWAVETAALDPALVTAATLRTAIRQAVVRETGVSAGDVVLTSGIPERA